VFRIGYYSSIPLVKLNNKENEIHQQFSNDESGIRKMLEVIKSKRE